MNIRSHLTKTIASSWFSLITTSGCQLVMIPVALAILTKSDFALYAIISQLLMAVMLAEIGARSACARLLIDAQAKGSDAYHRTWVASVCVYCLQAVLMLAIILALAPVFPALFHLAPEELSLARGIFITVGLINTFNYPLSIMATALLAGQQLNKLNMYSAVSTVLQMVVFIVALKMGAGLWAYPIALVASSAPSQVLIYFLARKYGLIGRFSFSLFSWSEMKEVFSLGFDVFVAAMFSMVMGNSLLILSGHLLTLEETAVLAINLKLIGMMTQVLQRIPGSADPILMQLVSEGKNRQFAKWWEFVTKMTISMALLAAGMFILWNGAVISAWTSPDMVMPLGAVVLLSLIPFRYLVHYQFVNMLAVYKEIRKVKLVLVWEIVLYISLAFFLGRKFGMDGLLAANLFSMLGGALFWGMKWFAVFSEISTGRQIALLAKLVLPLVLAFSLLTLGGARYLNDGIVGSLALSLIWCASFAGIGYFVLLNDGERGSLGTFLNSLRRRRLSKA